MRTKIFALGLALLLAAGTVTPAAAQATSTKGNWAAVQALASGEKVVVRTDTGGKFTGRFARATDAALTITRDGREMTIARGDIGSVSYPGGTSHAKGALVGAGIGGGAGLGFGVGFYQSGNGDFVKSVIPGFAALGAGIGAAFGMGKRDVRIYQAP